MQNKKILVAILNYNGRTNTDSLFLESIKSIKEQSIENLEIIVIDNHSVDSSFDEIRFSFPDIELVRTESNFATMAYNAAISRLTKGDYEYLLLCNNDIIFEKSFLNNMIEYASAHNNIGYLTPRIMMLSERNKYNSTGIIMNSSGYAWDRDYGKNIQETGIRPSGEVFAASGGALFITKEAAQKNGGFDSIYFAYYEDVDLSVRLRRNTSLTVHYVSDAVCFHAFSISWSKQAGLKEFYMMRNRFLLVLIHFPLKKLIWALRFLIFTSSSGNKKNDRRVYFSLFSKLPSVIIRRAVRNFRAIPFPTNLLENYHGTPRI